MVIIHIIRAYVCWHCVKYLMFLVEITFSHFSRKNTVSLKSRKVNKSITLNNIKIWVSFVKRHLVDFSHSIQAQGRFI